MVSLFTFGGNTPGGGAAQWELNSMAAWNIESASRGIEYRLPSISTETLQSRLAMIDIVTQWGEQMANMKVFGFSVDQRGLNA